ncbi:22925_t:CDS:2 [Rhizophagus irregularis]|nr:22925_t:CDS:2 [Rhizophagus irregularis]
MPFRYELERYSRQYTSNKSAPQWTHISQPSIIILENMFPAGTINNGAGEPILKVVSDQTVLLESLNVSYRYAESLKAKALLKSPTIGIRYNYTVLDDNAMPICQETRKIQLRFKTVSDFESCASIIERYINCRRMNDPTLNLNGESSISNQTQENTNSVSQFRTSVVTYNNVNLERTQREPSVVNARAGQHQQRIGPQNSSSTASPTSSYTSAFSDNTRNSMIQIDEDRSKFQLRDSQSSFTNNINMQQFTVSQQNNQVRDVHKNNLSRSSMNNVELHQSNGIHDQNQQIKSANTSVRQRNSQNNSLPHINNQHMTSAVLRSSKYMENEHNQKSVSYTNNQSIYINPNITQNEPDKPSYTPSRYMSVPPQVSTHKTHKAPLSAQNDQFSRQSQQQAYSLQQQNEYNQKQYQIKLQTDTNESRVRQNLQTTHHNINIENSQRTFNEQENVEKNETNITQNNSSITDNASMGSSHTDNVNMTFQSSHQSMSPNNRKVTNSTQSRFGSFSNPQKNILQNMPNLQLPCTQNQITTNSVAVQQVKIKQEQMDISPTLHKKEPYFIDLTINEDDNGFEFDFQPTRVPSSHIQAKSQPNLINQSQFAQSIASQVHLQPTNSDQPSTLLSHSTQNTYSSAKQISPHLTQEGFQHLRNRPLSTIQPLNNNLIQRQHIPLPEDDDELQDWILEILKDPNFPQFSREAMESTSSGV